jgi:Domain of unknown function (DUF4314)
MLRMAIAPGDRVELVATDDPYTNLQPGARGTVTGIRDDPERTIDIAWDNGSTLSILPTPAFASTNSSTTTVTSLQDPNRHPPPPPTRKRPRPTNPPPQRRPH